jgi:poly(hydroxyalkanoate) depolymerase family esterase
MLMNLDMAETFRLMKGGKLAEAAEALQRGLQGRTSSHPTSEPAPATGQFLDLTFTNPSGKRPYKLYIPSGYHNQPVPLIVMLHGCTQSPDDFATGTRMNAVAEQYTCIVAYPEQVRYANLQRCWNWFSPEDQQRGHGEPSIIAGITQTVINDYAVDRNRIYIAGLSAGGALAAIMAQAYPDLYAAAGIHSGLASGAAHDLQSAMAAMANGAPGKPDTTSRRIVPTIVFHGDRDAAVNPANADSVIAQALRDGKLVTETRDGDTPDGHTYTTTLFRDRSGATVGEVWHVHGGGHAWFGGDPSGSFTDPQGPDATQEMLRFFLRHRNAT